MSTPDPPAIATTQVQGGYLPGTPENPVAVPIYQTSAYQFSSLAEARELFALRRAGNIYGRNANPTQAVLERRITELEGGASAVAVASGQAAVAITALALAGRGGHLVAASQLYGGTVDLFADTFADLGIEVSFVDQNDLDAWRAAVRPSTRAFFAETVANPVAQVLDVRAVADLAHEAGVPLVVDATVTTPALQRSGEHGADIVVHSATKYLGGHGTTLGGLIIDIGSFDFGAEPQKWPELTEPRGRFGHRALWDAFGKGAAFCALVRAKYVHDIGPSLSPFNAFQILEGIETLDLRLARHAENGLRVARFLAGHPAVAAVHHPGLPEDPWHGLAERYLPRGAPAVFSFELASAGDREADFAAVERVIDPLRVIRLVANIGDARTLIAHPATMTHSHLSDEQLAAAGVGDTTIRLSVGLEDPDDIVADLAAALAAAT